MSYQVVPFLETDRDGGDETTPPPPVWAVHIVTPNVPIAEDQVEELFRRVESHLRVLESLQRKICRISITLRSSDGIDPASSSFLRALFTFLLFHNFLIAEKRALHRPLRLSVQLASDDDGDGEELGFGADEDDDVRAVVLVDRSDPVVQEVTDQICFAIRGNNRLRAAKALCVDVPVVPASAVLDLLLDARYAAAAAAATNNINDDYDWVGPTVTVNVSDAPVRIEGGLGEHGHQQQRPHVPDVLSFGSNFVRIKAEGLVHGTKVARHVLGRSGRASPQVSDAFDPNDASSWLGVSMYTPRAAEAFVQVLMEHRNHGFRNITLIAGNVEELGIAPSEMPTPPLAIDGDKLCGALLRCPSVARLIVMGIEFSASAPEAAQQALAADDDCISSSTAALKELTYRDCTFPDPATGPIQVATAMSKNNKLERLSIGQPINTNLLWSDMTSLCSALAESDWDLSTLSLHPGYDTDNRRPAVLDEDQVKYFFRYLPFMKTLKSLGLNVSLPKSLLKTVANGFKNNYWLEHAGGFEFVGPPDTPSEVMGEIEAYVTANRTGRSKVYEAVSNPDDLRMQAEAIEVLCRLSAADDDDLDDATSLFLCLQLFLPSLTRRDLAPHH